MKLGIVASAALLAVAVLISAAFFSCSKNVPPPAKPTTIDATDGAPEITWPGTDPPSRACAKLQTFHCPLGNNLNCTKAFALDPKFGADPTCVLGVTSIAGLAACNVECPLGD
jgi:hypothetical protein